MSLTQNQTESKAWVKEQEVGMTGRDEKSKERVAGEKEALKEIFRKKNPDRNKYIK